MISALSTITIGIDAAASGPEPLYTIGMILVAGALLEDASSTWPSTAGSWT